jgi:hypothetical protein
MNIKMKNILLIDDNEMDNYISEYKGKQYSWEMYLILQLKH